MLEDKAALPKAFRNSRAPLRYSNPTTSLPTPSGGLALARDRATTTESARDIVASGLRSKWMDQREVVLPLGTAGAALLSVLARGGGSGAGSSFSSSSSLLIGSVALR